MRAFIKTPGAKPDFQDIAKPVRLHSEVLLKVLYVGLCRTDLYVASELIWRDFQLILGHEFTGEVVECDDSSRFRIGDKVVVNPLWGKQFMGLHVDGALAEYVSIPETKVYPIFNLDPQLGAYAEPVAAAMATLIKPICGNGIIYGQNRIAVLTQLILASKGIHVPIVNENDALSEETYDFIIETVLRPGDGKKLCWALKPRGSLILKSRKSEEVQFPINVIVLKDLELSGVSYGDWDDVVAWISENQSAMHALLGPTFEFKDTGKAFSLAIADETQKIFIKVAN